MSDLAAWLDAESRYAGGAMLASISPVDIVKMRPGFGQRIVPRRGSVVASPVPASYDPDPDYFFHWYRDSAIVMDALRVLVEAGTGPADAAQRFDDFVHFSLGLNALDGRELIASAGWRARVKEDFARFLRSDVDLAAVHGEAVLADTRVNADGSLDISSWPRPQHDGAATRALTLLRWLRSSAPGATGSGPAPIETLLESDLEYVLRHGAEACFDLWEEEQGLHYYTLRVSAAALATGADWLAAHAQAQRARDCRSAAERLLLRLDDYWLEKERYYRSRVLADGRRTPKELDIAVILAVVHTAEDARHPGTHGVFDPRIHSTLERLSELFAVEYEINHDLPAGRAPALGRYPGDTYYSGGAYYFSTLAAAELCYRAATAAQASAGWLRRGDAFLETVRVYTPASGELSEQFDRRTGAQTSAKHLAWSYAALISCASARRAATAHSAAV